MPRTVSDVEVLSEYLRGVVDRAEHHAGGVDEIALAVAGAVLWKKDAGTSVKVMERDGELKNVLWVYVSRARYALSYNHVAGAIEVRQGTTHGQALATFTNKSTVNDVKTFFAHL